MQEDAAHQSQAAEPSKIREMVSSRHRVDFGFGLGRDGRLESAWPFFCGTDSILPHCDAALPVTQ